MKIIKCEKKLKEICHLEMKQQARKIYKLGKTILYSCEEKNNNRKRKCEWRKRNGKCKLRENKRR